MEDLFILYRYLARNQSGHDDSYRVALAVLEPVLDIVREAEIKGEFVREQGGMEWEAAQRLTSFIIMHHKTALCEFSGGTLEAVTDFALSHIHLGEIDKLIDALQQQKKTLLEYKKMEEDLGDLDDQPF